MELGWHKLTKLDGVPERVRRATREEKLAERLVLLARLPQNSTGAEVGVWRGTFSREILRIVRPRRLYLVDPWMFQSEFPGRLYGGVAARDQRDMDAIFHVVESAFAGNPAVVVRRSTAEDFFRSQPAATLDWAYIDGDHGYEGVSVDLDGAFHAVRPGGWIVGDDLGWVDETGSRSVHRGVFDFCERRHLACEVQGDQFFIQR